jgi:hypothetical protein
MRLQQAASRFFGSIGVWTVLGPLPKLYRVIVFAVALVLFVGGGAWAALVLPYEILVSAGASIGLAIGVLCAVWLVHDPHGPATPQRVKRTPRP